MLREDVGLVEVAGLADLAELLSLQKLAYVSEAEIYDDYSLPPLTQTLPQIQADFASLIFLKACADGVIVGSVRGRLHADTCLVGRLMVHPDARRQGLGTKLMLAIEQRFPPARRFELFTGHRSEGNLRLYERLGYREFDRKVVDEGLTLVFLEKIRDKSSGKG
jgi:GNAT superfamily N-acetyltransferase